MSAPTKIAVLQMTSGIDPGTNFDTIRDAAYRARQDGAEMLFTPEMSLLLDRDRKRAASNIPKYELKPYVSRLFDIDGILVSSQTLQQEVNPYVAMLCNVADEQGLDICLGSMAVSKPDGRLANRSMYFPASGEDPITYDKIHMFDVDLASGESWRESNAYAPGESVVTAETPLGRLGLTVCYDIRFPALFEELGRLRCDAIAIPSAFTVPTGKAHWHLLQRARAVEASAWVIAAAQTGRHADGRETYGHSLVVDPWGEIVLDMGREPGVGFATIDPARTAEVRAQLPSLANRREIPRSIAQ